MKIKSDLLRIQASDYDDRGVRLEPEEKPAERLLGVDVSVAGTSTGESLGSLKTTVNVGGLVGEFAHALRTQCAGCKFFDQAAFRRWKSSIDFAGSAEKKQILDTMRANILEMGLADVSVAMQDKQNIRDVEAVLGSMGVCHALTEVRADAVFVHPESTCPDEVRSASDPDGFFKPFNKDVERVGSAAFDQVMRNAIGKR